MFGGDKPGQDKVDKLKEVLGWVDGFVAEDKFCAGNSNLTIADIAFVATYSSLKVRLVRWSQEHVDGVFNLTYFRPRRVWAAWISRLTPTSSPGLTSASSSSPTTKKPMERGPLPLGKSTNQNVKRLRSDNDAPKWIHSNIL